MQSDDGWQVVGSTLHQPQPYKAHIPGNTNKRTNSTLLRRRNALKLSPLQRLKRFFGRLFWNQRSKRTYKYSKRYLQRKPSNLITPDTSRATYRFRCKDLLYRRPKPRYRGSSVPVQVWKSNTAQPNPLPPNLIPLDQSSQLPNTSTEKLPPKDESNTANNSADNWVKVSLPEREQTHTPAPGDPASAYGLKRDISTPQKADSTIRDSDLPKEGPYNASKPENVLPLPQTPPRAVSREGKDKRPSPTSTKAKIRPKSWRLAHVPREEVEPEIIDIQEAMDFVDTWGAYLRRAIAHRAILRKQRASWEQEQEQRWSNARSWSSWSSLSSSYDNSETSSGSRSSYYSTPETILEAYSPTSTRGDGESYNETWRQGHFSSSGRRRSTSIENSLEDVPKRYSALFEAEGFQDSPWVPEASVHASDIEEVTPLRPKTPKLSAETKVGHQIAEANQAEAVQISRDPSHDTSIETRTEYDYDNSSRSLKRMSSGSIRPTPELYERPFTSQAESERMSGNQESQTSASYTSLPVSRENSRVETDAELLRYQHLGSSRLSQSSDTDDDVLTAKQSTLQTAWNDSSDRENH